MPTAALLVFAKVPEPGRVKTRLTTLLTDEEAAGLYTAFLRDALRQYQSLGVDVRLYLAPTDAALPAELVPEGVTIHPQRGNGLGARMAGAFVESFATGYERLVIIGTDHPTLPSAFIEHAFSVLADPYHVVLGPSEDGGYYLLGMNEFYPALFRGMTYSHADVFAQTLDRLGDTGAEATILPTWFDVDTPEALHRLRADLDADSMDAPDHAVPHTRRALADLAERLSA